jgi:hypothetical protein
VRGINIKRRKEMRGGQRKKNKHDVDVDVDDISVNLVTEKIRGWDLSTKVRYNGTLCMCHRREQSKAEQRSKANERAVKKEAIQRLETANSAWSVGL